MDKKIVAVLGIVGLLAVTGVAFAENASTTTSGSGQAVVTPRQPMVLQVGPGGKVLLRGTVNSVSTNSLNVKSWGGDWTVNVLASAELMPQGIALSAVKQGDFVGVQGTVDQSASWTVSASLVRDWTERQALNQEIRQNVQTVRDILSGVPRNVEGTLSALSDKSFTLTTKGGTSFSVTLASGAQILQRNWLTLDFGQVQNGDMVRVWGPVASSTISASIFRDLSIPR